MSLSGGDMSDAMETVETIETVTVESTGAGDDVVTGAEE